MNRPENPFGSRFTRPGAIRTLWSPRLAEPHLRVTVAILNDLASDVAHHHRCAIVGAHGSGKSTLLADLTPFLNQRFASAVQSVTLRAPEGSPTEAAGRHLPGRTSDWHHQESGNQRREAERLLWQHARSLSPGGLLVVDGFEQLPWLQRGGIMWLAWWRSFHLLITTHAPLRGFRTIHIAETNDKIAWSLTTELLADYPGLIEQLEPQFSAYWTQCQGNLRQLWSSLYDWFETRIDTASTAKCEPRRPVSECVEYPSVQRGPA
jgi:energy-coupling factor transporter ATP-binding protein EcfA2